MAMPGRTFSANSEYRYGFNGQEKSTEIDVAGNSMTAEFWQYDGRIGRRWNVDPKPTIGVSDYATFNDNPISYNDIKGDCPTCRDGKYKLQKGDTYASLEKKWKMKKGTLQSYNTNLKPQMLKVGATILTSPIQAVTPDNPSQSVMVNAGTSTITPSSFKFDEDFPYDPTAEATLGDKASWIWWGAKGWGGGIAANLPDGIAAYRHYRDGGGANKTFDFAKYKDEDVSGAATISNIEGILKTNLPIILPYAGGRDFNIPVLSANDGSKLFKYPATENWQKAIGAFNFWVTGTVTATDVAGKLTYTVNYTLHAIDRYNFNKKMKDIKTGIKDDINGRFSTLGWAHSYLHQSEYYHSLKF